MRIRRYFKISAALLLAAGFALVALFSGSLYTWSVLTDEALVAELQFEALGPQHYEALVVTDSGCRQRTVELFGDQWRLDARFLKWKNWAMLLGLDANYRLTRIEGRYASVEEQNTRRNLAWSLEDGSALDIVELAADMGDSNFLVDSTYGSSTFQDIDPESIYRVYRTQTGLIARTAERPPQSRPGAALVVEVRNACGAEPSSWQRFTRWLDTRLGTLAREDTSG
ncbi:MAG TPA: hypothetical protein VKQ06_03715 [Gammaproteobacteria bacterium]|nr:hypothetical protein [Gammaproteobacteria bacterium]